MAEPTSNSSDTGAGQGHGAHTVSGAEHGTHGYARPGTPGYARPGPPTPGTPPLPALTREWSGLQGSE